jgi:hypothetical protein
VPLLALQGFTVHDLAVVRFGITVYVLSSLHGLVSNPAQPVLLFTSKWDVSEILRQTTCIETKPILRGANYGLRTDLFSLHVCFRRKAFSCRCHNSSLFVAENALCHRPGADVFAGNYG